MNRSPIELHGVTVLVVDQDSENRLRIESALANARADVVSSASGEGAIMLLQARHPDVIVSDTELPDCDGYHLLKMVRTRNVETPAIAITGTEGFAQTRALLAGFQSHVAKPLRLDELLRKIRELIAN